MQRKTSRSYLWFLGLFVLLALPALACGGSFSTANISSAVMSADNAGSQQTTVFSPGDTFFAIVQVANAPSDTTVGAVWIAVNAEGVDPNFMIDETVYTTGDGRVTFSLENDSLWPAGQYRVDIYLNGELDRSLSFQVR